MANIEATVDGEYDAFIDQQDGMSKLQRTDKSAAFDLKRVALYIKNMLPFYVVRKVALPKLPGLRAELNLALI